MKTPISLLVSLLLLTFTFSGDKDKDKELEVFVTEIEEPKPKPVLPAVSLYAVLYESDSVKNISEI
tara:strand:- start:5297 stop:5494 length:198 start_codon:yes stop_codon:yes gene_type:complete